VCVGDALEVMRTPCHLAFDLKDESQVGAARRAAVQRAESLGFDAVATGRVALIVTELGTNLVRHAARGRLLIDAVGDEGARSLEVLAIDEGPGIENLAACLEDGYSSSGTTGNGFGAVRRLADQFDAFSAVPSGTVVLARIAEKARASSPGMPPSRRLFEVGAVALPAHGEVVCGDAWTAVEQDHRIAVLVADGLGHGPDAAEAAGAAVQEFRTGAFSGPSRIIEQIHKGLRATRGAAVAVAQIERDSKQFLFSGAGNISGRVLSGVGDRSLVSQHGTAGVQIRSLRDLTYEWPAHGLLILHSDGLKTRWTLEPGLLRRHPSVVAAWLVRDHRRGSDDVTVVVLRRLDD
jgi:anti-sigma regulatory factor (Ser/Thr protein kinase)